jgi:hypothetical protein
MKVLSRMLLPLAIALLALSASVIPVRAETEASTSAFSVTCRPGGKRIICTVQVDVSTPKGSLMKYWQRFVYNEYEKYGWWRETAAPIMTKAGRYAIILSRYTNVMLPAVVMPSQKVLKGTCNKYGGCSVQM